MELWRRNKAFGTTSNAQNVHSWSVLNFPQSLGEIDNSNISHNSNLLILEITCTLGERIPDLYRKN